MSRNPFSLYLCRRHLTPLFPAHTHLLGRTSAFLAFHFFPTGTHFEKISYQAVPLLLNRVFLPSDEPGPRTPFSLLTRTHSGLQVRRHRTLTLPSERGTDGADRHRKTDGLKASESVPGTRFQKRKKKSGWSFSPAEPHEELARGCELLQGDKDP